MQSKASTVDEYLRSLPEDRRTAINAVRAVILKNLDSLFKEGMLYGMIGYYVPHSAYPKGYHCDPKKPLPFAVLGSQKNYLALHLMAIYAAATALKATRSGSATSGPKQEKRWTLGRPASGSRKRTTFRSN